MNCSVSSDTTSYSEFKGVQTSFMESFAYTQRVYGLSLSAFFSQLRFRTWKMRGPKQRRQSRNSATGYSWNYLNKKIQMCALLGYYAASSGNPLSSFRDSVSVPSSRVMILDP
jgi:hypothetical protein